MFSPRAGFYALALVSVIPVFFYTGFLLNPEAFLGPLWLLVLLAVLDLRDRDEGWRPLVIGACIGLAFLAKYTAILAVPVVVLFVAESAGTRRWLRRPSFYAGGFVALACTAPVLLWNARRGWPSLHLHLSERLNDGAAETLWAALWRVGRAQIAFFQPLILVVLFTVLGCALARSSRDDRYRFLATASLPVLAFLLVMMVRTRDSEPHWTMVGYVPLVIAAGGLLDESARGARWASQLALGAVVAASACVGVFYAFLIRSPALIATLRFYDPAADPVNETIGWDRVKAALRAQATVLGPTTVVAGAHNVLCGHLTVALDDAPAVYCVAARRTEFDFIGRRRPPAKAPVLFVDSDRYPADPARLLPGYTCARAGEVDVDRASMRVRRYRIAACVP